MTFAFRADGSGSIGMGHLMRCLCLAETLRKDGSDCFFITKEYGQSMVDLIRQKNFDTELLPANISLAEDLNRTVQILAARSAECAIVDSYEVDERYLTEIKKTGIFLISIDDKAKLKLPSDLIINPNLGVSLTDYRGIESSKILLGPAYAMLRGEFKAAAKPRSFDKTPKNILLSFGGSDTASMMEKVTNRILQIPAEFKMTIAAGPAALQSFKNSAPQRVRVEENTKQMAKLMTDADFAILSAGTLAWEAACLGLPALLIQIADNQKKNAEQLDALGAAVNCGTAKHLDESFLGEHFQKLLTNPFKREQMSLAGQKLVDGNGTNRILSEIKKRMVYEKNQNR